MPCCLVCFPTSIGTAQHDAKANPAPFGAATNPASAGKTLRPINLHRRRFLLQSGRGASATLVAAFLRRFPFVAGSNNLPQFYLRPHYRFQTPLDKLLLEINPADDVFSSEADADRITNILSSWSRDLLQASPDLKAIFAVLANDFRGGPLIPARFKTIRSNSVLEVREGSQPAADIRLSPNSFLDEWKRWLGELQLISAEFQITALRSVPSGPGQAIGWLETQIRYQFVGSSNDHYREQRIGSWNISWQKSSTGEDRIVSWTSDKELRSSAREAIFADVSARAFDKVPSYHSQLCKGADYWRTVLDAACGIDIYGHNGVAVGDIDGDGVDDLYVCQGDGLPNRLYRNRGDGTFEDMTELAGVGVLENTACALFVDVNNDGRQDLIVVRTDGPVLFLNQGSGRFVQKPGAFRFATPPQGTFTGAAAADYDRDGWVDIYFCLYVYYQGTDQYKYPSPYYAAENGPPNFMFRNQRDATFRDVTAETGLTIHNTRYSFCCGWSDFNGDGWPDLYVVNDFGRKNLYRNNKDGTFTDIAEQAHVEDIGAGMSVCWLDYDNDGAPDLYVADMWTAAGERVSMQEIFQKDVPESIRSLYRKHARGNSLFRNRGNGTFEDISAAAGVEMGRWSWSSDSWDFDHDGYPDLYVTNGMVSGPKRTDLNSFFWREVVARSPHEAKPSHDYEQGWTAVNELLRSDFSWSGYERNVFFVNNHDGTFSDVSGCVGLDFIEDGRSFALSDIDGDGRIEIVLKNRNAPQVRVLKNVMTELAPSISFRLTGRTSNRDAIGASIILTSEFGQQRKMIQAGSAFLSQHSKQLHFGLGEAHGPLRAKVRWPNGIEQEFDGLPANHSISIREGENGFHASPYRNAAIDNSAAARPPQEDLPDNVETWLLAPVTAPDCSLQDRKGENQSLRRLQGRLVLLGFVTSDSPQWQADLNALGSVAQLCSKQGLTVLAINFTDRDDQPLAPPGTSIPILHGTDDVSGVFSILYRYLFDRHREIPLPTSFLINPYGEIVKIYQGALQPRQVAQDIGNIPDSQEARLARALPFPGITDSTDFRRNYLSFGSAFFQRGYFDQAAASFEHALRDNPQSAEAEYGLGSVYLKQGKNVDAQASFQRATQLSAGYPDTLPDTWNNLGLLAARDGRMAEAVADFQKALALSPDHVVALNNLGNAYRQMRRWDDAGATFEHAMSVAPENAESNYGLAMVYAQQNDVKRAYEYLQKAIALRPGYPEALNNLGILYLRTDQPKQAVASFEECIRSAPDFNQAYLNLAQVYQIEGATDKARALLEKLLSRHPDDAQAKAALAQLPR